MNDIIVIDNLVDVDYQDQILKLMTSWEFDWHIGPSNWGKQGIDDPLSFMDSNTVDTFMHTHRFYGNQLTQQPKHAEFIRPLIQAGVDKFGIDRAEIFRVKGNLLTNSKTAQGKYHPPHVDGPVDHLVMIYYVNDSDGDTIVFNETFGSRFTVLTEKQRISPKKGRAVCFPGKYFHTGCSPTENNTRLVINCDILIKPIGGVNQSG